jgi:hypothetical protein
VLDARLESMVVMQIPLISIAGIAQLVGMLVLGTS